MTTADAQNEEEVVLYHITVPEGWNGFLRDSNGVLDGDIYLGVVDDPCITNVLLRIGDIEISSVKVEHNGEVYWRPSTTTLPLKAAVFNNIIQLRIECTSEEYRPTIGWYHLRTDISDEMFKNTYEGKILPGVTVRHAGSKARSYKAVNASETRPVTNAWRIRNGEMTFTHVD